jgi:hypothetical protein
MFHRYCIHAQAVYLNLFHCASSIRPGILFGCYRRGFSLLVLGSGYLDNPVMVIKVDHSILKSIDNPAKVVVYYLKTGPSWGQF